MTLATSNSPGGSKKVLSQLKNPERYAVFGSLDDNVDPIVRKNYLNFSESGSSLGCCSLFFWVFKVLILLVQCKFYAKLSEVILFLSFTEHVTNFVSEWLIIFMITFWSLFNPGTRLKQFVTICDCVFDLVSYPLIGWLCNRTDSQQCKFIYTFTDRVNNGLHMIFSQCLFRSLLQFLI